MQIENNYSVSTQSVSWSQLFIFLLRVGDIPQHPKHLQRLTLLRYWPQSVRESHNPCQFYLELLLIGLLLN